MNYFIRLLLIHLFLFIVTKAENATYRNTFDENIQRAGRIKRVPFHEYIPPDILNGRIKDGDEIIHIVWHKVERHLMNENVPVYTAHLSRYGPLHTERPQIMKNIGNKMIVYHSTTHKSVLVYSAFYDLFYGMVDKRYYLNGVSLDELLQLKIDEKFVQRFSPVIHECWEPSHPLAASTMRRANEVRTLIQELKKRKLDSDPDMVFKKFYIEILVFIPYDIYKFMIDHHRDIDHDDVLEILVFRHLIHFHAVDMLFAQLPQKDFEIYLNLAGFIVEVHDGVFSEITGNLNLRYNNGEMLDGDYLLKSFEHYRYFYGFPFTKDSFDLIYLSTGRPISTLMGDVSSLHSSQKDIFAQRLNNYGKSFVPMAVVQIQNTHEEYVVSAHEIAHSFGIKETDPEFIRRTEDGYQCYGIMQSTILHCPECITWSDESITQLRSFFKYDRNRCFLINKPRSLLPRGTPLPSYSPCGQCRCFGYGCYGERKSNYCTAYVSVNSCDKPLACRKKFGMKLEPTISPLDGTICGSNKVCWEEKCVDLPTKSGSK